MNNNELIKILAVDDESSILNSLRRVFVEAGYIFISAESGAEGLEVMRLGNTFDVIISDFRMPAMNGVDFLTIVHELQPQSLRILLTGQASGKDVFAALKSGVVTTHIPKPWDNENLLAVIENWIADKKQDNSQQTH